MISSFSEAGYLAARLRAKWANANTHEAYFRDTAHGFLAWAFATLLMAGALSSAASYLANGAAVGSGAALSQAGRSVNPSEIYVDKLFRADPSAQTASSPDSSNSGTSTPNTATSGSSKADPNQTRAEVVRLWTSTFHDNQDFSATDKAYLTRLVATRTGLSQADAEKRVNDVVTEAKTAADNARRGAAKLSVWLTVAMLFGAFAASLAAVEGGSLRDGTWNDRVLTPRPL
jgi:hypothetical protein